MRFSLEVDADEVLLGTRLNRHEALELIGELAQYLTTKAPEPQPEPQVALPPVEATATEQGRQGRLAEEMDPRVYLTGGCAATLDRVLGRDWRQPYTIEERRKGPGHAVYIAPGSDAQATVKRLVQLLDWTLKHPDLAGADHEARRPLVSDRKRLAKASVL